MSKAERPASLIDSHRSTGCMTDVVIYQMRGEGLEFLKSPFPRSFDLQVLFLSAPSLLCCHSITGFLSNQPLSSAPHDSQSLSSGSTRPYEKCFYAGTCCWLVSAWTCSSFKLVPASLPGFIAGAPEPRVGNRGSAAVGVGHA